MTLVKAKLVATDKNSDSIEFMFNPAQLVFNQSISLTKDSGAHTARGLPKVNFSHSEARTLRISDIWLDTYEEGESVLDYVQEFEKALKFAGSGEVKNKRPPTYIFTWGNQQYIRCFVTSLAYTLTMFLPDGTPVRAKLDLNLEEIDESIAQPNQTAPKKVDRAKGGRKARLKQ